MGNQKGQEQIILSHYDKRSISGENIINQHAFAFQMSGSLTVRDGSSTVVIEPGDFRLNVRNKLAKFTKQPATNGTYDVVSVIFDEATLRSFAERHQLASTGQVVTAPVIKLKKDPLYRGFIDALQPYLPHLTPDNTDLVKLKVEEALIILMKVQPELKDVLFDFADPAKIDLKAFMEQHYKYNLSMARFAYLTGRSLSAFKRDFEKAYHITPAKWLQQKRLEEAYYLLKEKHQKTSDVYAEVGFEDLSHFSFVFKKHFGISPSLLNGKV